MYTCVYLLGKPFSSNLETHTNEINVSQVSATLYTFMPNTYAWCGNVAKCIQIPLYRTVIFLVRAYAHILDSDLREIWFRFECIF